MEFLEKIDNELKAAMKGKETVKVSTLRMLKAAINRALLDQNKKTLNDDEIIKIIGKQIKQHKDSIDQFEKGNRADLVEKEKKELAILLAYMPEAMPVEEITKIVEEAIKETGATEKKDMGKVMKIVMAKTKGRADGKTISQIVSGKLV